MMTLKNILRPSVPSLRIRESMVPRETRLRVFALAGSIVHWLSPSVAVHPKGFAVLPP